MPLSWYDPKYWSKARPTMPWSWYDPKESIKRRKTQGEHDDNTDASRKDRAADLDNPLQQETLTMAIKVFRQQAPPAPTDAAPEPTLNRRSTKLTQSDFATHGYTSGCPRCEHALAYGWGKTRVLHNDRCRTRIERLLAQTPMGAARVQKAQARKDQAMYDHPMFVRRSIWLAAESWRRFYGQMSTCSETSGATLRQFHLLRGQAVSLPQGWSRQLRKRGQEMYLDPDGIRYSEAEMLEDVIVKDDLVSAACDVAPTESRTVSQTRYYGYDQLDDWHYRGMHPILVDMPLYEYSRWVYRVELPPFAVASAQVPRRKPRHIDIPFCNDYALGKTWIQRLSREPRVPRIDGMKFHSDANPEMQCLMKSLLLRPVHIPPPEENLGEGDPRVLKLLHAYQTFCTSANAKEEWQACGRGGPGPFQKSYAQFKASMEKHAEAARRKRLVALDYPSFWDSFEVQQELQEAVRASCDSANAEASKAEPDRPSDSVIDTRRPTVQEYFATEFFKIDANFSGIAAAQSGKPKRQIDEDRHVLEEPVARNNDHGDDGDAQARMEANDERALLGLADLSQNTKILHRFDDATFQRIIEFRIRERYSRFTKELRELPFMKDGLLPTSNDLADAEKNRRSMEKEVRDKFGGDLSRDDCGLALLMRDQIKDFVVEQRKAFESTDSTGTTGDESDDDFPPDTRTPARAIVDPKAYFSNDGRWRRPSDYIAYLAAEFEAGNTTLPGKEKKKKKLTRDQVIFLIGFANACNNVWEDECNETPMESRREYAFLLMGQGGSGKTAIVQEIVLPSIDFVFPPEQQHGSSSIVVCASWAQAQTMSTTAHKAVSCHNATFMRVQSQRNTDMLPKTNEAALEAKLSPKRALIIEEVSMIPPSMYNMLLYRFYHGRKKRWRVTQERLYVQRKWAFGRMPQIASR